MIGATESRRPEADIADFRFRSLEGVDQMVSSKLIALSICTAFCAGKAFAQIERTCPRTLPPPLEMSGGPFPSGEWYGSESLAVLLKPGGVWKGMGAEHRYRDKLAWWSYGFDPSLEPRPALVVTGKRLDAEAPPAIVSQATNMYFDGWAMLVMIELPSRGCWEISGDYLGQTLSFVVEVDSEE